MLADIYDPDRTPLLTEDERLPQWESGERASVALEVRRYGGRLGVVVLETVDDEVYCRIFTRDELVYNRLEGQNAELDKSF